MAAIRKNPHKTKKTGKSKDVLEVKFDDAVVEELPWVEPGQVAVVDGHAVHGVGRVGDHSDMRRGVFNVNIRQVEGHCEATCSYSLRKGPSSLKERNPNQNRKHTHPPTHTCVYIYIYTQMYVCASC